MGPATICDESATRLRGRVMCGLSILAIILSSACLIIEINTLTDNGGSPKATVYDDVTCVECAQLIPGQIDEYTYRLVRQLFTYPKDGLEMCCAKNSAQMQILLELVLQRPNTRIEPVRTFTPANFTYSGFSAHKRLLPSVPYISKPGLVPQFSNTSNTPLLFDPENNDLYVEHARNVEVLKTGLRVLHSGLYFVYSSIRFNPDSTKPCSEFAEQTWHHDVVRGRPNERQSSGVILSSLHTCCDDCVRDKETSYTGGSFYLQASDHLHVEVSGYALIRFDQHASYFGLYMLAGEE